MPRLRAALAAVALVVGSSAAPPARADGPGLPNLTYPSSDVFKVVGRIDATLGAPRAHGTMLMHRGHLAIVFAPDSGKGHGGFAFFDLGDPRAPKLVGSLPEGPTTPDLEWPTWIVYSAVPFGSYLMCFRFMQVTVGFLRSGELPHHDHGHVEGIEDEKPLTAPGNEDKIFRMADDLHPRETDGENRK